VPFVTSYAYIVSATTGKQVGVLARFTLQGDGFTSVEYALTLDKLKTLDYSTLHPLAQVDEGYKQANQAILRIVQQQLKALTPTNIPYIERLGWLKVEGQRMYFAGDKLIGGDGIVPNARYHVKAEMKQYRLAVDGAMTVTESCRYTLKLMSLKHEVTLPLVGNLAVGLLYPLIAEMGYIQIPMLYLLGKSGITKTVLSCLTSSIYNRDKGFETSKTPLTSTLAVRCPDGRTAGQSHANRIAIATIGAADLRDALSAMDCSGLR
jgi:hypothetical protein